MNEFVAPTMDEAPEEPYFPWRAELSSSTIDVTLMVPCCNEADNVEATLQVIHEATAQLNIRHEIIVIDDGSTDGTADCVKRYKKQHPERLVRLFVRDRNCGLAANFFDGAFMARGKYYRIVCGDNVEPVPTMVAILGQMGKADIILPYHTHVEGRHPLRIALSRTYVLLVNLLSGNNLYYYNGAPLFRTWDVLRWHIDASGFGFQAELVTRLLDQKFTYIELPVTAQERTAGKPRALTLRNWMSAGHTLLKIALRALRRRLFLGLD